MSERPLRDDWEFDELRNRAVVVMGHSPPGNTYNENNRGVPLINGPVEFGKRFPTKIQWTVAPTRLSQAGDVLFCVRGSTTGRMNVADDVYCIGRGVAAIRGVLGKAETPYLEYLLQQVANAILEDARGSGSTFPSITGPRFASWKLLFPPPDQQRKIARILTTLDNVITQTEALIAKYQAIKQGLMHDLFTRGVDATGKLRPPQSEAPELYKQSALGWIPKEWEVSCVESEFQISTGFTLGTHRRPTKNIRQYLRVANVQRDEIRMNDIAVLEATDEEFQSRKLQVDDLLVVEGHADPNQIGRCARVTAETVGLTFQNHLFRLQNHHIQGEPSRS